jgi:hypothetical protein
MSGKAVVQSLGFSTDRWLGLQCVHVERQHLQLLRQEPFLVCEKTDGIESLLCAAGGELVLIDRAYNTTRVELQSPLDPRERTILDGELINGVFHVFDAVLVSGTIVGISELPFRLEAASRWVAHFGSQLKGLKVEMKMMFPWASAAHLANSCLRHGRDGLVFTPFSPLLQRRIPTLKWKERKAITVDFLVQSNYDLMVIDKGESVRVSKASHSPSIVQTKVDILLRKGQTPIVECSWSDRTQD